ncbi:MAG: cyclic nucleotide-binding domain-containing protein [Pseudomonadales bacterium]|nr:cyclic nucleotide-binding domain-containing protein [Pseudomonadales bacterium]
MAPANPSCDDAPLDKLFGLIEHAGFDEGTHWYKQQTPANTAVIKKGERSEKLYLVCSGTLSVQEELELPDQRHIKPGMAELGPGSVFGELALFDEEPHSCSVVTLTDAEFITIHTPSLLSFLSSHTEIGYPVVFQMMQQLAGRFRKTSKRTVTLFAWGLKAHGIESHL